MSNNKSNWDEAAQNRDCDLEISISFWRCLEFFRVKEYTGWF